MQRTSQITEVGSYSLSKYVHINFLLDEVSWDLRNDGKNKAGVEGTLFILKKQEEKNYAEWYRRSQGRKGFQRETALYIMITEFKIQTRIVLKIPRILVSGIKVTSKDRMSVRIAYDVRMVSESLYESWIRGCRSIHTEVDSVRWPFANCNSSSKYCTTVR